MDLLASPFALKLVNREPIWSSEPKALATDPVAQWLPFFHFLGRVRLEPQPSKAADSWRPVRVQW